MSAGNQGGGDDKKGRSTLKGAGGFQARHGSLTEEERRQLAALQKGEAEAGQEQQGQAPAPQPGHAQQGGQQQLYHPQQAGQHQQYHQQQQQHAQQQQQPHQQQHAAHQQQQHAAQHQQHAAQHQQQHAAHQQQQHAAHQQQQYAAHQQQQHAAHQQQPVQHQAPEPPQAALPVAQVGGVDAPIPTANNPIAIALGRAYRAAIRPEEVTDGEREKLLAASPPVTDPFLQGFLAWRKSVLLAVALLLVPVTLLKMIDFSDQTEGLPGTLESLLMIKLLGDVAFAGAIWFVLPMWTQWRRQRRILIGLWFGYFAIPFLIFLYPWISALEGANPAQAISFGLVFSLYAVMSLAPKAISLMPGLMRGSIAVKLLLPGSSAPGWLIALAAPMYAIFFYVILVMPYQVSGSGFFVGAMVGFTGAQIWMARMGYHLARPERHDEAAAVIKRVRVGFHLFNGFGVLMLVVALFDFADKLDMSVIGVVDVIAAFIANVLLLTVIATDLLLTNLHKATQITSDPSTHQAQLEYLEAIKHFAPPSEVASE